MATYKSVIKDHDFKRIFKKFNGNRTAIIKFLKISYYGYDKLVEKFIGHNELSITMGSNSSDANINIDYTPEEVEAMKVTMAEKFNTLEAMSNGVGCDLLSGILVSGPGGVGKTYTVEKVLDGLGKNFTSISGHISPMALYEMLHSHKEEGEVIVFDDCDSVFDSEKTINILKAALDTREVRKVSWNSPSPMLNAPPVFTYQGNIVFLTNKVLKGEHFEALVTRVHHIDLSMNNTEIMIRIEQVADSINHRNATPEMKEEVLDYMKDNAEKLNALSIRSFLKALDLRLLSDDNWKSMIKSTMFK